jgi:ER protein Pkr1
MSSFIVNLWESIFTPGPTPTLLIATNATFGCLQVLLLILLFFTSSYHFLILSVLCGGLWAAINWFASELAAAKTAEEKAKDTKEAPLDVKRGVRGKSPEQGSDTETELDPPIAAAATTSMETRAAGIERRKPSAPAPPKPAPAQSVPKPTASQSQLEPKAASSMGDSDLLKRPRSRGESSGYVSTDSEWEKVSEGEGSGKK